MATEIETLNNILSKNNEAIDGMSFLQNYNNVNRHQLEVIQNQDPYYTGTVICWITRVPDYLKKFGLGNQFRYHFQKLVKTLDTREAWTATEATLEATRTSRVGRQMNIGMSASDGVALSGTAIHTRAAIFRTINNLMFFTSDPMTSTSAPLVEVNLDNTVTAKTFDMITIKFVDDTYQTVEKVEQYLSMEFGTELGADISAIKMDNEILGELDFTIKGLYLPSGDWRNNEFLRKHISDATNFFRDNVMKRKDGFDTAQRVPIYKKTV